MGPGWGPSETEWWIMIVAFFLIAMATGAVVVLLLQWIF